MPTSCSACTNRQKKGSGVSFHSFPHDPLRREKWVSAMGRYGWTPSVHASLCSIHFEEKCFDRTGQTIRLRDGSIPTLFVPGMHKRFKKAKKQSETFTGHDVKQEKQSTENGVITKRQIKAKEEELTIAQELDVDDHTYPKRPCLPRLEADAREAHCFVCDKLVINGTSLHCLTNTTKVHMHHKLYKLMAKELEMWVNEQEVLCSRCARLLNYVDRIEVELAMLNRSILNCIRGKHILGLHHDELQSRIPDFNDNLSGPIPLFSGTEFGDNNTTDFITKQGDSAAHTNNKDVKRNLTQETFKCQTCFFKTVHKSVMISHLQEHVKSMYQCDFSNDCLSEKTLHLPNTNEDYEQENSAVNGHKTMETNICDIEAHKLCDDALYSVGSLLQDVSGGKVPVHNSRALEMEMKTCVLDRVSVENMLEELHETGQVSAFISNNTESGHCRVKNMCESKVDTSITTPDTSSDRCSLVKLELCSVDESAIEITVEDQHQLFVDFGPVKTEALCNLTHDSVDKGT